MAPHRKRVAVIGGGISGLAAARSSRAHGHEVVVFERSADGIGGVWQKTYPDVKTQSPKELYAFSDEPFPAGTAEWPSGDDVRAYAAASKSRSRRDGARDWKHSTDAYRVAGTWRPTRSSTTSSVRRGSTRK